MTIKVLIFGASGLMMAPILPHIKAKYNLDLTAYIRPSSPGIPFLTKLGVGIIEGKWDDAELIKKTIKDFDIIWDSGDSHDAALPRILVPAMLQYAPNATLIRFTGTGNWVTPTGGNADPSARTYDDNSAVDIQSIHDGMFNGTGDNIALDGLKKGLNVFLLCTGGVYGPRTQGITSYGVFVRLFTNAAVELGYVPYMGDGGAHMQMIHLDDVVSATDILLEQVIPTVGKPVDPSIKPHQRFFNAPGYSVEWKTVAETWSKVLKDNLGLDLPVKNVPREEAGWMVALIEAEMKAKPTHMTKLGWAPRGPKIEDCLKEIIDQHAPIPLP